MNYEKLRADLDDKKIYLSGIEKLSGIGERSLRSNFFKKNMTVETLEKICSAGELNIHDYFDGTPSIAQEQAVPYLTKQNEKECALRLEAALKEVELLTKLLEEKDKRLALYEQKEG